MIDVVLQNAWVLYDINKDEGDESLPLLACNFSKIFKKKKKIRMSHRMSVMRWHITRCHLKDKASVRCEKITSDGAVQNVKQMTNDKCFEILHGY